MYIHRVIVIKSSEMAHILYFLLMSAEKVTVWTLYLFAFERSYLAVSENAMDCWTLSYH